MVFPVGFGTTVSFLFPICIYKLGMSHLVLTSLPLVDWKQFNLLFSLCLCNWEYGFRHPKPTIYVWVLDQCNSKVIIISSENKCKTIGWNSFKVAQWLSKAFFKATVCHTAIINNLHLWMEGSSLVLLHRVQRVDGGRALCGNWSPR